MKTEVKHSPTPFTSRGSIVYGPNGLLIAETKSFNFLYEDAAFIVRACNSHEVLVEACKKALDGVQRDIAANPTAKTDRPEIEALLRAALEGVR